MGKKGYPELDFNSEIPHEFKPKAARHASADMRIVYHEHRHSQPDRRSERAFQQERRAARLEALVSAQEP